MQKQYYSFIKYTFMKNKKLFLLALSFAGVASLSAGEQPGVIPSDEGLFPFVITYDIVEGATDYSFLLDAPAGKYGFTRVEGKHFVNDNGPIRFNATNLTGAANFPTHEEARRMAARMARFGINCVRLHFMDSPYGNGTFGLPNEPCIFDLSDPDDRRLDPVNLDRLEFLIYQFKKVGIYVDVNLHVARHGYSWKGRNAIDAHVQEKELEYAHDLLTHRNPYTGLTLATDPCVAVIELNNEDAHFTSSGSFRKPEWPSAKEVGEGGDEIRMYMLRELESSDRAHWDRQRDYLVNELGVKVPVTSTQISYSEPWAFEGMDYWDMHAYWCHPAAVGGDWTIDNRAMVNAQDGGCITNLASYRPSDRPYTISEYNHPYPIFYGAEGQPMLHAYGAFHGWDGVFAYSWNNRCAEEPTLQEYFFSYAARTDCLAHFIACATMYLRGDVKESPDNFTVNLPRQILETQWKKSFSRSMSGMMAPATDNTFKSAHRLMHRNDVDIHATETCTYPEEEITAVKMSDTQELEWNNEDPKNGIFVVRTENTKFFSGFPEGRTIDWGDGLSLTVGDTKLGWATISLTSKEQDGFKKGNALLVATGYTHNTGEKFTTVMNEEGKPTTRIHSRHEDWGKAPMLTEGIPATVTLPAKARKTRCWALDERGQRCQEVPVTKGAKGKAVIAIGPQYKTVWYEIESK